MPPDVPSPADRPVAFRVLGPVEVVADGTSLALGGRRQRTLLALLLTTPGQPISADRLEFRPASVLCISCKSKIAS